MSTRKRFEKWLAQNFDPMRTASGRVSKSRGVIRYQNSMLKLFLGGPIVEPMDSWRAGDDVPYRVKKAIEEIVEIWEPDEILHLRRDQSLSRELSRGRSFCQRHGHAPDGGGINAWAKGALARLNEIYGVTEPPECSEWSEFFSAPANNIRRRRHQRAA